MTRGKFGSVHKSSDGVFVEVPALATHVADRVGAGDAVLAMTSLLVFQQAPWEITGFVGNAAGAHMVSDLGNRSPLGFESLAKQVVSLMK